MSQELIYTSAPRGLKPGSQGFCTVVSTQGMSPALVQRLESLSGYRHVFGPQDANARLNPVLCSHLMLSVAGRRYHVLSRICDAGLDYTQRTNKFAHHVVLDPREAPPTGPAWLLAAPGFMQASWNGSPKLLPAGRIPPQGQSSAAVCRAWQQATGDAGWGGALAETGLGSRAAVIVYRPGFNPLPLVAESLALLPPERRWSVSFSTYYNKLPPGVDCQWRCVVEGSPEAVSARTPGALVIDLTKPIGRAAESAMVAAARTGVVPQAAAAAAVPRPAALDRVAMVYAASADQSPLRGDSSIAAPASTIMPSSHIAPSSDTMGYDLGPPPLDADALRLAPAAPQFRPKPKSYWPLFVALGAVSLLLIGGIVAAWIAQQRTQEPTVASAGIDSAKRAAIEPGDSGKNSGRPEVGTAASSSAPSDSHAKPADSSRPRIVEQNSAAKEDVGQKIDDLLKQANEKTLTSRRVCNNANEALKSAAESADSDNIPLARFRLDEPNRLAKEASLNAADATAAAREARSHLANLPAPAKQTEANVKLAEDQAAATTEEVGKLLGAIKALEERVEKAQVEKEQRTQAIANSLKNLDGTEVDLPRCEKAQVGETPPPFAIAAISDLGIGDYQISPLGADGVLPKGCSLDVVVDNDRKWYCKLAINGRKPVTMMVFTIQQGQLLARWTDLARPDFHYANQLRNCLWLVTAKGIKQQAMIRLGKPEPMSSIVNAQLKFSLDPSKPFERSLNLDSIINESSLAVEPINDQQITSSRGVWPSVARPPENGQLESRKTQHWQITIGKDDHAKVIFNLSAESSNSDQGVKLAVKLKCAGENVDPIETIKRRIANIDGKIEQRRAEERKAKENDKGWYESKIHELQQQKNGFNNQITGLEEDLTDLRDALNHASLRYRIALVFGSQKRVLYTTERIGN